MGQTLAAKVVCARCTHESRVTSPPIWVQNLMLPPLWALAMAFGVRPYYDRWDSRIRGPA